MVRGPCFQSSSSRCRLPYLLGDASSKSTGFPPPEARAARDHTSPTRKSTRTRRYGKLQSGKTSAPGRRRLPRAPAGSICVLHPDLQGRLRRLTRDEAVAPVPDEVSTPCLEQSLLFQWKCLLMAKRVEIDILLVHATDSVRSVLTTRLRPWTDSGGTRYPVLEPEPYPLMSSRPCQPRLESGGTTCRWR